MTLVCGLCHAREESARHPWVCPACAAALWGRRGCIAALARLRGAARALTGLTGVAGISALMWGWVQLLVLLGARQLRQGAALGAGLLFLSVCWCGLKTFARGLRQILRPDAAAIEREAAADLQGKLVDSFAVTLRPQTGTAGGDLTVFVRTSSAADARAAAVAGHPDYRLDDVRPAKMWPWEGEPQYVVRPNW